MDNVTLITMEALGEYVPQEWASFKDLIKQIKENAKSTVSESPFFLTINEQEQAKAIFATAMYTVKRVKGDAVYGWLLEMFKALGSQDITELSRIMEKCPDKSLLPIT